jgi:S1-C subfamily serine protease
VLLKLVLLLVTLAPVPAPSRPDPLGFGYLGVGPADRNGVGGLVLSDVREGQPAAKAGLRPGDELVRVGTATPRQFQELVDYVCSQRPGTALKVEVKRAGRPVTLTVVLGARPAELGPPVLSGGGRPQVLPVVPPNR